MKANNSNDPPIIAVELVTDERPADAAHVGDSEAAGPMAVYFRDIARSEVMTRDEECQLAARIEALRHSLWRAALNYPPFVASICELAREVLPAASCPTAALDAMILAARKLRDRDLRIHREQYASSRETLTQALAAADPDNLVSDRMLADLTSIEAGQYERLSMKIKSPPRGSQPFLTSVHAVRHEYHAFWAARAEFVEANLKLVVAIARRYSRGRMALPDLIQEGNLGLMKAVNRFDPRRGCRFSTYGSWWIRHAVTRAMADKGRTVRLPVHVIDAYGKVLRARRQFEARHGRPPTDTELSETCDVSPERLARMSVSLIEAPVSLDKRLGATDLTLLDAMEDTSTPPAPEAIDHHLMMENLHELFDTLLPLEADILRKRMGMDDGVEMTLKEIGKYYGLSRERIHQLQEQALAKLRAEFARRGLL